MHFIEAKHILSSHNGMNIYRGCSHGCIYCDTRSDCYGFKHDFEDIEVKINAPELLEQALKSKRCKCMIGTGSMSDPYLHIEKDLKLTRKCLEVIEKYGFGVTILTKSDLILRDLDLLVKINQKARCVVQMTLTTYDENLCKLIEPNVATTKRRFEVLKILQKHGIPCVVWLCPILPHINDNLDNLKGIMQYCIDADVKAIVNFGFGVTMRDGNREYYYHHLDKTFKGLKRLYHKQYQNSYNLLSPNHPVLLHYFKETCYRHQIICDVEACFQYLNYFPQEYEQLSLF